MTKRKLTERDLEILKVIWSHGGEITEREVAAEMKLELGWARVYLKSLGKADLIDIYRSGKVKMTYKGRTALGVPDTPSALRYFERGKEIPVGDEDESVQIKAIRRLWG